MTTLITAGLIIIQLMVTMLIKKVRTATASTGVTIHLWKATLSRSGRGEPGESDSSKGRQAWGAFFQWCYLRRRVQDQYSVDSLHLTQWVIKKAETIQSREWDRPQSSWPKHLSRSPVRGSLSTGEPWSWCLARSRCSSAHPLEGINTSRPTGQISWHGNGGSGNGPQRIAVNSIGTLECTFEGQTTWHAQQLLRDKEAWLTWGTRTAASVLALYTHQPLSAGHGTDLGQVTDQLKWITRSFNIINSHLWNTKSRSYWVLAF